MIITKQKLILGDSFEELPLFFDNVFDIIIIDPPYGIDYCKWDKLFDIKELTKQFYRILKINGQIFFFAGWSNVCRIINDFDNRFILNDWIIYDRIKGRGCKKRLVSTREDILWYVKSNTWTFNKDEAYSTIKKVTGGMGNKNGRETRALSNVWSDISPIVPWSKEHVSHPTQKPIQLIERILKVFTNEGDTCLDSFMGSGTTGVACKNLNRNFVGIEINKEYYDIAQKRIINSLDDLYV